MKNITAIIVVKNNPSHLFESLASIDKLVSEIIIGNIDIGNDFKKKLLLNNKVKIVNLPSQTPFADLVKEDLKKQAKGEYILYLDPDEIFPVEPVSYLLSHIKNYDYFLFPRKNIIFGKWIIHSRWWPDYQLRLFKRNSLIWPKTLHPDPPKKGNAYRFEAKEENALLHYNYDNIDQFLEKATRYSKAEANYLFQTRENLTLTQTVQKAISEFISRFFAHDGYKDGMHGLTLGFLQMFYYFLVYFYFWELKKYPPEKNLIRDVEKFTFALNYETSFWLLKKNLPAFKDKIRLKIKQKLAKILS